MKKFLFLIVFLGLIAVSSKPVLAGSVLDYANSANYNLKFTGSDTAGHIATFNTKAVDIDGDGKNDLLIGAWNGSGGGSVYLIYGTLLQTFASGSTINLDISTNYNVRFRGTTFAGFGVPAAGDIDGDGKMEIVFNDVLIPDEGGSLWVVNNRIFGGLTGTGNLVDVTNSANYNFRFSSENTTDNGEFADIVKLEDLDGNGRADLLMEDAHTSIGAVHDGALYVVYDSLLNAYGSSTGNDMPLGASTNYSLRIERNGGNSPNFSYGDFQVVDINGDGQKDLLIGSYFEDFNNVGDSGSVYVLYHSVFGGLVGTGNIVDVSDPANYSIRFDGDQAVDSLGGWIDEASDVTGDGQVDLILGASRTDANGRIDSGSVYVIDHSLFSGYAGTGNNVLLSNSANWTTRIDGAVAGERLNIAGGVADFTNSGQNGLLIGAVDSNNGRTNSGSFYVLTQPMFSLGGTGKTVDEANSANYFYRVDGAAASDRLTGFADNPTHELAGWDLNTDGGIDILSVARGAAGGGGALYVAFSTPPVRLSTSGSGTNDDPNRPVGWAKRISAGPHYKGNDFSFVTVNNRGEKGVGNVPEAVGVLILSRTHHDDLNITFSQPAVFDLPQAPFKIPLPWSRGFNVDGEIYWINAVSAFNGFQVVKSDGPFILRLPYKDTTIGKKIIWFNPTLNKWQNLSSPLVVDYINRTLLTTTNQFGFFAVGQLRKL